MTDTLVEQEEEVEVCRSFRNNARCRFGDECKFEHSEGPRIEVSTAPRDRGECFNWRDTMECSHGDACRFAHGPDDQRTGDISEEICRNFLRGRCNNDDCPRRHEGTPQPRPRRRGKGVCFAWRDDGECERGDECIFSHPDGDVEDEEPLERPRRRQRKKKGPGECYDYRDGQCDRGDECRFTHGDEPTAGSMGRRQRRRGACYDFRDGQCDRGDDCRFSHDDEDDMDQMDRAPRARKSPGACYDFLDGICERGEDCRFSHEEGAEDVPRRERRTRPVVKLDEICNNFLAGKCRLGVRCRRIHEGAEEVDA